MAFSSGAQRDLHYIVEETFGTTPATPAMIEIRNTEDTLSLARDSFVSNERRGDRGIHDMRLGNKQPAGDLSFEFSYDNFDDFLAAVLCADYADVIANAWIVDNGSAFIKKGTKVTSFSIQKRFSDITQFHMFRGCIFNGFSLEINPNAMVTGTFNLLCKDFAHGASAYHNSLVDVAPTVPFDGFTGDILEGGGTTNARISSLSISLNNGFERNFVLMSNTCPQMTSGKSTVTGTVTLYFANSTEYDKFANEVESSIKLTLEDKEGNEYEIFLPRIKYTTADTPVNSDGAIIITMNFQALDDETEATNIKITRTDAV